MAQVKDKYNFSIFYVILGKKISTNVNHAEGKLSTDQVLCKSNWKCKIVPNFDNGRNVLTISLIKEYIPVARTA